MLGAAATPPFDAGLLRRGRDLRAVGIEPARGEWHHVRKGIWVHDLEWRRLTPGQRHAALVHATAQCLDRENPTFALTSAAAVWGFPRVEAWPDAVHVLVTTAHRGRGSSLVRPHVGRPDPGVRQGEITVTSVARTVVDLARTGSFESALAAADYALRHSLCTRAELMAEVDAVPARVRGHVTARLVGTLADPLSMSPGESLSRAQMYLLNLPRPTLQQPIEDARGLIGVVDFGWDGVVGEFDGKVKYRVAQGADPDEASESLWLEKKREDRLRRRVEVARWTWDIAVDRRRLAARLAEHGIHPMPVNTWIDLGRTPRGVRSTPPSQGRTAS